MSNPMSVSWTHVASKADRAIAVIVNGMTTWVNSLEVKKLQDKYRRFRMYQRRYARREK